MEPDPTARSATSPVRPPCRTVLEIIQSTTLYFSKRNIESPRLNAEHLIAHGLGKKRLDLYLEFDRALTEAELAPIREIIRRRADGEPLQHVLGTAEFYGRSFLCDGRALVPRPETEQLVELVLEAAKSGLPNRSFLDVGTGSGVIALTLAAEFPEAEVHAVDVSREALALAHENAERLGLAERVRFYESDLLGQVDGAFGILVANLPYIAAGEIGALAPEVRRDPARALEGGAAGHEIMARLILEAPAHLAPGGLLALEIGHDQAETLSALLRAANFQEIRCVPDLQRVNRFLLANYG